LRIRLSIPKKPGIDLTQVEKTLRDVGGVEKAAFNGRTKNVLITLNGNPNTKGNLLRAIENMPLTGRHKRGAPAAENLVRKKKSVIKAGAMLLISPLTPPPAKPFIALYGALPIIEKGVRSLLKRGLNIDVLDSLALSTAIGMRDYRTAGVISLLLKVGDYLEEWTKDRSRKILTEMFRFTDDHAWIKNGDKEERVKVVDLKEGDAVIVRTGGRIAVDGIILEGEAMVNQSSLTGEPLPAMKRQGTMVYAGTAIEEGFLTVKALSVGGATRISKIVKLIEESEDLKADVQSHAEKLANRIVPYSFLLGGLTYALTGNPAKAASALLVDYSCAIKLSSPLTIMATMMKAAKKGVLIKGGKFIEKMADADVFVLDKTGTLTEATPKVVDVIAFNGYSRDYILRHAACLEEHFPHPVATAVVKKAKKEGVVHDEEHADVEYVVAHGIASRLGKKRVLVGSKHFIHEDEGIAIASVEQSIDNFAANGHSILYVAIGKELAGVITIEDPLRDNAQRFLRKLKKSGVKRIIMVTGDNEATARNVAKGLGIKEYYAQVLPEEKTGIIKRLKDKGHTVAMIGDGVNDSPALSHADVGISMKQGADIAKEACDILLLDGNLLNIIDARIMSRTALSLIKQNFGYIVGINSALLGLGLLGAISPAASAFAHNVTTVGVTLNSLRPLRGVN